MGKRRKSEEALQEAQRLLGLLRGLQQVRYSYQKDEGYRVLIENMIIPGGIEKAIRILQNDIEQLETSLGLK